MISKWLARVVRLAPVGLIPYSIDQTKVRHDLARATFYGTEAQWRSLRYTLFSRK